MTNNIYNVSNVLCKRWPTGHLFSLYTWGRCIHPKSIRTMNCPDQMRNSREEWQQMEVSLRGPK